MEAPSTNVQSGLDQHDETSTEAAQQPLPFVSRRHAAPAASSPTQLKAWMQQVLNQLNLPGSSVEIDEKTGLAVFTLPQRAHHAAKPAHNGTSEPVIQTAFSQLH